MSDLSVNLSLGGAFYRASQNTAKVNKAVNQMLNRLETGEKYQYAYQNVSAVTEGAELKSSITTNQTAVERNKKYQEQLDPVMTAQNEIIGMLGKMKEIQSEYNANSTGSGAASLEEQYKELGKAATALAAKTSFNGTALNSANTSKVKINENGDEYTLSLSGFTFTTTDIKSDDVDAAITAATKDSARLGVLYDDVLGSNNDVMTSRVNAMSSRYSSLVLADDNETSALLSSLSKRMDSINASKQYNASYAQNSISIMSLMA